MSLVTSTLNFARMAVAEAVAEAVVAVRTATPDSPLVAIDATAGGGNDTAHLARLVGHPADTGGHVHAFDVQAAALEAARARLVREGLAERVTLHHAGHETMAEVVHGPVAAVMFNLGFLPKHDSDIITQAHTTLPAIDAALSLLAPRGVVTIACYSGHPGGAEETASVEAHVRGLSAEAWRVVHYEVVNRVGHPVRVYAVRAVSV